MLANVLRTFTIEDNAAIDDCAFDHDEADITIISYVLEAVNSGKRVIRVLSDDTDVFVLLIY